MPISFFVSVCLSVRIRAAPTIQISVKFGIEDFQERSAEKLQIWLKSDNTGHLTQRTRYMYIVYSSKKYDILHFDNSAKETHPFVSMATLNGFILLTATGRSTKQRKGTVAFP